MQHQTIILMDSFEEVAHFVNVVMNNTSNSSVAVNCVHPKQRCSHSCILMSGMGIKQNKKDKNEDKVHHNALRKLILLSHLDYM